MSTKLFRGSFMLLAAILMAVRPESSLEILGLFLVVGGLIVLLPD